MAYQRWWKTIRDQQGNAVNGASVSVYNGGTGTLALVFDPNSSDSSPSILPNPFTTSANGVFGFMAVDGEYDVQVRGGALATQQYRVTLNASTVTYNSAGVVLAGDLAAPTGSGMVGYIAPYTGAVARTQDDLNQDSVSVFNFLTDAEKADVRAYAYTSDVTASVQKGIDYLTSIGGGTLHFPSGGYYYPGTATSVSPSVHRTLDGIVIKSNVALVGEGPTTVFRASSDTFFVLSTRLRAEVTNDADNIKNIQIRNIRFECPVIASFNQQSHLVMIESAEDVVVDGCQFVGWNGDAICLGLPSDPTYSVWLPGIVKRVKVSNCFFDGVTKQNRQAISIITGQNVDIHDNYFTRTTSDGSVNPAMPGAIDIEPEIDMPARNITIHDNYFTDIGGTVAVVTIAALRANLCENIRVYNNEFENNTALILFECTGSPGASATTLPTNAPTNISFTGNKCNATTGRLFKVEASANVDISDNTFIGSTQESLLAESTPDFNPILGLNFTGNVFRNVKVVNATYTNKGIITINGNIIGGQFSKNNFTACGFYSDVSTPACMNIFAFINAVDCNYLVFTDNIISSNGIAYIATSHPFVSQVAPNNPGNIVLGRNTVIGPWAKSGIYDLYVKCRVVGTDGLGSGSGVMNEPAYYDESATPAALPLGLSFSCVDTLGAPMSYPGVIMSINVPWRTDSILQFAWAANSGTKMFRRKSTNSTTWGSWTTVTFA